jgi:signal transduction histidine kinase
MAAVAAAGLAQGTALAPARSPRPALLVGIVLAGVAAAAVSVTIALGSDHLSEPGIHAALMNWITLTYVIAGAIAWWRRPESRFGPLMIVAGFAIFLSSLSSSNGALLYTVGIAFDLLPAVLFTHVFLAFPSGRLRSRFERALVTTGYAVACGVQLVGMALGGFGPDNLLAIADEPGAASTLLRVELGILSALCLVAIGVLFTSRPRGRRPLALLIDAFALALLMIAVLFGSAALGLVSGQPAFETLRRVMLFVIGLAPLAFLAGLLQARLARSAVGDLLVYMRANPAPAALRGALARALRDPSLTLVYWLPEFESWADLDGQPVRLAEIEDGRTTTLIEGEHGHVAALLHDPSLDDQPELVEAVAAAAAIALENARLHAELRARLDELKGSRTRLVDAADAERRRLERNLHDGAQQRMVAVALQLRLLQSRIRADPAEAEQLVTTASDELAESLSELRELARGLHPAVLERGLGPALHALATRSTVPASVTVDTQERLPEKVELAAYFVASEALANVAKHSRAGAVAVRVSRAGAVARIEIADDGVGGADDGEGSGLRGLADRVEALDGALQVVSPPGAGTVVIAELPLG